MQRFQGQAGLAGLPGRLEIGAGADILEVEAFAGDRRLEGLGLILGQRLDRLGVRSCPRRSPGTGRACPSSMSCRTLSGTGAAAGRVVPAQHLQADTGAPSVPSAWNRLASLAASRSMVGMLAAGAVFQLAAHDRSGSARRAPARTPDPMTPSLRRLTACCEQFRRSPALKFFFSKRQQIGVLRQRESRPRRSPAWHIGGVGGWR